MSKTKWIINRYAEGKYPRKTDRKFRRWLVSDNDSEAKDEGLEEVWEKSRDTEMQATYTEWLKLKKRINESGKKRRMIRIPDFYRVAAAVAVIIVTAVVSVEVTKNRTADTPGQISLYTDAGEKQMLVLPDSSTVLLNSKSLVIYPESFSGRDREIFIVGEAILNVSKDADRPFTVNTPNISVEVLGTVFNISDYLDENSGSVVLKEGRVKVSAQSGQGHSMYMSPGDKVTVSKADGRMYMSAADVEREFAWKDDQICFNKSGIYDIARTLEREFGIEVNVTSGKYNEVAVTAKFMNDDSLEDFLFVLENIVPDFKYRLEGSYLYIL